MSLIAFGGPYGELPGSHKMGLPRWRCCVPRHTVRRTRHAQTPRRRRLAMPVSPSGREPASRACLRQVIKKLCRLHMQRPGQNAQRLRVIRRGGFIHSLRAGACPQASLRRQPRRPACTRRDTAFPRREWQNAGHRCSMLGVRALGTPGSSPGLGQMHVCWASLKPTADEGGAVATRQYTKSTLTTTWQELCVHLCALWLGKSPSARPSKPPHRNCLASSRETSHAAKAPAPF